MAQELCLAALYKFVPVADKEQLRDKLLCKCKENRVLGILLIADEGINGTICAPRSSIDRVLRWLREDARFSDLKHKESYVDLKPGVDPPFKKLRVRLKKEIVTIGVEDKKKADPLVRVGQYVKPRDWNSLIERPDVTLVDTRNDYEIEIGTFKGAVNPNTSSFRDFPTFVSEQLDPVKNPKVAMFCTGGIRCEKASSFLLSKGFKEVYHLEGGILKYFEEVPEERSLWDGECYVFDKRISVDHSLRRGRYDHCHACRRPMAAEDKEHPHYEQGVSCKRCYGAHSKKQLQRFRERERQVRLEEERAARQERGREAGRKRRGVDALEISTETRKVLAGGTALVSVAAALSICARFVSSYCARDAVSRGDNSRR